MEVPQILFMILVAAVVIVGAIVAHQMEKKRRAALAAWAAANGFDWRPAKRSGGPYPGDPFDEGHSRWSRYHGSKTHEGPVPGLGEAGVKVFEYHYAVTRGSGKNRRTDHYHFTCIAVAAPLDLGEVMIRTEHWGDKLAGAFGFDDIDMEDPDFSKRYHVSARDRRDAYELIGSSMMRYLAMQPGDWRIRTMGRLMLGYASGRVSPERYDALLRFTEGFLAQLPRTLVNAERARLGLEPLIEAGSASTHSQQQLRGGYAPRMEGA